MIFLSCADMDVGELLELPQGCQGPFRGSGEKVRFLERCCSRKKASAGVEGRISWFFSSFGGVPLELQWGLQGPTCGASARSSLHPNCEGPLGIPLQSLPGLRASSGFEAGTSGFLSRNEMDLSVPLGRPPGSQGLVSFGAMQVRSPLEPEKQFQSSCRVDLRDRRLSLNGPQGCHTCHHVLSWSSG